MTAAKAGSQDAHARCHFALTEYVCEEASSTPEINMRTVLLACIFAGLALLPGLAFAQAAVPIGYWTTADNSERLLIGADTSCSFVAVGGAPSVGNCAWQSGSQGGILTLYYSTVMGLAPIYWSVVWVNQATITVNGDVFYRRQ